MASESSMAPARTWLRECTSIHQCGGVLSLPALGLIGNLKPARILKPSRALLPRDGPPLKNLQPISQLHPQSRIIVCRITSWIRRRISHISSQNGCPASSELESANCAGPAQSQDFVQQSIEIQDPDPVQNSYINRYLERHSSPKREKHQKPKRLVDLRAFGVDSMDARIIDSTALECPYATLSYCWGATTSSRYTTTTDTLSSRMLRIEYALLPTTFKQAFEITRALDIRYLWIDALCILQDSQLDWEEESTKMGAIYGNSFLTIAADWCSDVDWGLYNQVSENILGGNDELIRITSMLPNGRESSLYLGAWAYQERIFSPRVLHYTQQQLFWECRQTLLTEDMIPRSMPSLKHPQQRVLQCLINSLSHHGSEDSIYRWYLYPIGKGYARRSLTLSSDKLPAISALARLWSLYIQKPYLAGLWNHDLRWGLCWYRTGDLAARPISYRSPSWSWASVDCDVWWPFGNGPTEQDQCIVCIEEANVQIDGQDPFGWVSGGFFKGYRSGKKFLCQWNTPIYLRRTKDGICLYGH